jgi:hypothetical protein
MRTIALGLLVALSSAWPLQTFAWPTLAEELAKHKVPSAQIDDREKRITSYEVFDEDEWFAIAYYWDAAPLGTLRFRVYDRRRRAWQFTTLPGDWGSVTRVNRSERWWYVTGHWSPSAVPTLALSADLKLRHELKGWPELILPDGRVVYQNNMPHFSPAYPESVSLYDPVADRDVRLFPSKPDVRTDQVAMDRTISEVRQVAGSESIRFVATEQRIRVVAERGQPDGPQRRLSVSCDLRTVTCKSTPIRPKQ